MADLDFDLFGDPVHAVRRSKGRPSHEPTPENRNKIMLLFALGWKKQAVADAMKLSLPTLEKHYFSECKVADVALLRVRARQFELLMSKAEAGDVGAIKELGRQLDKVEMKQAAFANPVESRPPKIGKKQQMFEEAKGAHRGTGFEDILQGSAKPN